MHPSQGGTQKKSSGERIRDCLHYFVFEFTRPEEKKKLQIGKSYKLVYLLRRRQFKYWYEIEYLLVFSGRRPFIGTFGPFLKQVKSSTHKI